MATSYATAGRLSSWSTRGLHPASGLPGDAPVLAPCAGTSLAARGEPGAIGLHLVPPLDGCRLVELTRWPSAYWFAVEAAEGFFARLRLAAA